MMIIIIMLFIIGICLFIGGTYIMVVYGNNFIISFIIFSGLISVMASISMATSGIVPSYKSTKRIRKDKDLADYEHYSYIAMRERSTGRDDSFNQNLADKAFARMVSKKK